MPETATASGSQQQAGPPGRQSRRHPRNRQRDSNAEDGAERPPRAQHPRRAPADAAAAEGAANPNPSRRGRNKKPAAADGGPTNGHQHDGESATGSGTDAPKQQRSRKAQFGAKLTGADNDARGSGTLSHAHPRHKPVLHPQATDLTNRLVQALSTPPYPDCAMCVVSCSHARDR